MPKPKTYAIMRVSTAEQADEEKSGIPTQRKIIKRWQEQHDLPQPEEVIDAGLSARNLSQITYGNFGKLLNKLQKQTLEPSSVILLFAFSDRFSRAETSIALQKFLEITSSGIDMVFCDIQQHVSATDDENVRTGKIMMVLSSFQQNSQAWLALSNRMVGAWEKFRQEWIDFANGVGPKPTSNSLMGKPKWFHNYEPETKTISVNKERAKYVQLIFDLFTKENMSLLGIARHFNSVLKLKRFSTYGLKSKIQNEKSKNSWTDASISYVLKSLAVIGQHQFFETVKVGKKKIQKPIYLENGELAIIDNFYEPIVSKTQFYEAQKLLENNKHNQGKTSATYPFNMFRGILFEGYNNLNLSISVQKKKFFYFKSTYAKNFGDKRKVKTLPAKDFEKAFFSFYRFATDSSLNSINFNEFFNTASDVKSISTEIKVEIDKLEQANNRLLELIELTDNKDNRIRYDKRITENTNKKDSLIKKQAKLTESASSKENKFFQKTFYELSKFSEKESIRKKMATFLKSTEHKIYVYPNGLKWDKKRFLKLFSNLDPVFGQENSWENFNYITFAENPLAFLFEYQFLKFTLALVKGDSKSLWEDKTNLRKDFVDFFGDFDELPERANQNIVVYCNNPEGEDFVGIYNKDSKNDLKIKYIADSPVFWFKKVHRDSRSVLSAHPHFDDCQKLMIKNKANNFMNMTLARFILQRYDLKSTDEDEGKKVFDLVKMIARSYPEGWRLHAFTRLYFSMLFVWSQDIPWNDQ